MDGEKKGMGEFVPLAKKAVADILLESKDDVRERLATKILESEGHLVTKPQSLTMNKKLVMNLDGKAVSVVLERMSQVFGGDEGPIGEVDFEVKEDVVEERLPVERPKRLIDRILEKEGEKSGEGVPVEGVAEAGGEAGNGPGSGKVGRKRGKKAQKA